MTLPHFNSLGKQLKCFIVLHEGAELAERESGVYHYTLYSIGNFYVEVISDLTNDAEFKIEAFSREQRLQPYIADIDITFLLQ